VKSNTTDNITTGNNITNTTIIDVSIITQKSIILYTLYKI